MHHLISAKQFVSLESLMRLFRDTDPSPVSYAHKVMATWFAQTSTRTRVSFESAMLRLGGKVVSTPNTAESSTEKGETLSDSARVLSELADIIVLRHPMVGSAALAAKHATVPVINAGDGSGEHPTQALLDLFTIYKELSRLSDLKVAIIGDLFLGRTVHSLIYLLSLCLGIRLITSSPVDLRLPREVHQFIEDKKMSCAHFIGLERVLCEKPDVVYMTRMQDKRDYPLELLFKKKHLEMMKDDAILMHPGPRREEICPSVDKDPRAVYWKQVGNGMKIRQTIIRQILQHEIVWEPYDAQH